MLLGTEQVDKPSHEQIRKHEWQEEQARNDQEEGTFLDTHPA
jgi:hypothetical protein